MFARSVRKREKRALVLTSVVALAAAMVAPVLVTASAQASPVDGYTGVATGSGPWMDSYLGQMAQGVPYDDGIALDNVPRGCGGAMSTGVPAGLTVAATSGDGTVSVYGTPTGSGALHMVIEVVCFSAPFILTFDGVITPAPVATTTTLGIQDVAPYRQLRLVAHVTTASGTPTGFVQFSKGITDFSDPVAVDGSGDAVLSTALDISDVNSNQGFSAHFVANDGYTASYSSQVNLLIYGGNGPSGHVKVGGTALSDATVDLLDADGDVAATTTTDHSGAYSFNLAISTISDAVATYRIRATVPTGTIAAAGTLLYYSDASALTSPTSLSLAQTSRAIDWTAVAVYDINYLAPPTWTDSTLGDFQVGTAVHDGVTATGSPVIHYSVSTGSLPDGVHLDAATGALSGTPTADDLFEFTLTATNDVGHVDQHFQDIVRPAPSLNAQPDFEAGTELSAASVVAYGSGLEANSTYTITAHSSSTVLETGTANILGAFSTTVALPADLPTGPHSVVVTARALDGSALSTTIWFTVKADGTIGAVSLTGPFSVAATDGLASTGTELSLPIGLGVTAFAIGALLLVIRRRQRA